MHTSTFQSRSFVWFLLYLIGLGLGPTIRSQAQGYVAPSPDAMALARQASSQVSHYTGTLGISIPLATLPGRELSVTASLSYHAAGNKVADIASSEGLGWSLSAGGLITRVVRGTPDDLANGFCTANKSDTEPDLFIFSFMGRSGKFVLDRNGSPVLYPYQDLVIKPGICVNSTQTWEMVDENGTRYLFGASMESRETTTMRSVRGGASTSYVSSWHLSSVISANGTDEIRFLYNNTTISYTNYFYTKYDFCTTDLTLKDESIQVTVDTRHISSIASSAGYIQFNWSSGREDIAGGVALSSIRVTNRLSDQTHTLRFEYAYFQAPGCDTEICKRLRLEKIFDLSGAPLYSFEYNTAVNLPGRNSNNFDHWGYFNNNTVDSWLPAHPGVGLAGASREPDESRLQANILTRMNKRGGSYQRFTYEIHRGMKNGLVHLVSGARIKSIENGDGQGNIYTTSYTYLKANGEGSGILFRKPSYAVYLMVNPMSVVVRRYSHSYAELWDVNGAHLGYSRVEEATTNSGKVVYSFTNYDTNPDLALGGDA